MNLTDLCNKLIILFKKPECFFAIVASFFGLLFLLLIPPFQTPDENVHFYRAYEVSELGTNRGMKDKAMGSMLPASIAKTEEAVNAQPDITTHIQFNPYNKYRLGYTKRALLDIPLNQNDKSFYRTETYPMVVYAPQALAVAVAKIFNAPIIIMLYMTRLANLVVWVAVVFACIKYFPWKKWALVGVGLLPVVVSQTISPGLDVLAISSTLVFLTLVFNGIHDRRYRFTTKKLLLLFLAGIAMVFTKSTLAVFFPLLFLIKGAQIPFKYKNLMKIIIVVLPVILFAIWTVLSSSNSSSSVASPGQQISTLLHNPFHFVHLLLNTGFFVTISGNALAQSIIGYFGWLDTPLSPFITYLGVTYISFLLLVGVAREKYSISRNTRLFMLFTSVGLIVASFLAMYVYSTLPGDNHIKGVQGRYLVPAIIVLIPVLLNRYIITQKSVFTRVVQIGSTAFLAISVLTITARYYHVFIPT